MRVPAGVADGTRLRLKWPASDRPAGYATVRIRSDEWMRRDGTDVIVRLPVSFAEAAVGATIDVSLPDGPVSVDVPAGTQPGDRIRIPGRGCPGRSGET